MWWRSINRRRKVSILNPSTNKGWYTHISPVNGFLVICATLISIFGALLLLASHTTILEILPSYRTAADKSRLRLIENIQRVDSMQRVIGDMILYNENVGLILEGKTPVARTTIISDSTRQAKLFTPINSADSALRASMEGDGEYSLKSIQSNKKLQSNTINFSAPIEGIITDGFDLREHNYGVKIAATSEARISAVEDGVVMLSLWSPESGNVVQILHPNNIISIYKNLSQALVGQGESVKRGDIIGYNSKSVDNAAEQLFEFEMWSEGKPANPERYIIF